ncbi:MAG: right-handed parallel beta-helix repeat-containing protein [Candidatus Heimdallarchaeota archaeon]|nr:right-handed parallel beta-helix repeat-containing protein [Candidatus Heimdallarchaeota archaeon]
MSVVLRRIKRKHIILLVIITLFLHISTQNFLQIESSLVQSDFSGFTSHDPIIIKNDDDFLIYGFPGNGTPSNPYLIEDYHILGIEDDGGSGISIRNTSKIYIIKNCYISEGFYGISIHSKISDNILIENNYCYNPEQSGINIDKSTNLILRNNTIFSATYGIRVYDSINCSIFENDCLDNFSCGLVLSDLSNSSIRDNFCFDNRKGIYVINSERISFQRNNCTKNSLRGIELKESNNLLVKENFCKQNSEVGIYLSSGLEDINITNNTCIRNEGGGITTFSLKNITLEYNNLIEDGFVVGYSKGLDKLKMRGNYVNNKPVGFFTNIGEVVISNEEFGQLFLINCISILIKNLDISRVYTAFYLINCEYVTIQNCQVLDCNRYGISVKYSKNIVIEDNLFWSENRCDSILLSSCKKTVIRNNTCKSITKNYGAEGIVFFNSNRTIIERNWIFLNTFGIFVADSSNCTIAYNIIENNTRYGIYMRKYSDDNIIHHNTFIGNNFEGISQVLDSGKNNTWFDPLTKEGNYWSDYEGEGKYNITGSANSKDPYPLDNNLEKIHETDFSIVTLPIFLLVIFIVQRRKKKTVIKTNSR